MKTILWNAIEGIVKVVGGLTLMVTMYVLFAWAVLVFEGCDDSGTKIESCVGDNASCPFVDGNGNIVESPCSDSQRSGTRAGDSTACFNATPAPVATATPEPTPAR